MEDLRLPIKAEIDTSDVDKDLSKVAENTAKDYQKAYEGLMNTVNKSFSEMKSNLEQLKSSDGVSNIFEKATKAVELYNSEMGKLKSTANMDPVTSKLYNLERELAAIARQILTVKTDFDALNKAAEVKIDLEKEFGSFEAAEKKLQELREERDRLQNVIPGEYDHALLGDMSKQLAEIDKMKASISELFKMRQMLISSGDTSETTVSSINIINTTIQSLNQNLMQASKEFYKVGRDNNFGTINSEIIENVRNLEQWRDVLQEISKLSERTGATRMDPGMAAAPTQLGSLSAELDQTIQKMNEVISKEDEIASKAQQTGASFADWRNVVWSLSRVLGNVYTIGLDIVRTAKRIANVYKTLWTYIKRTVSWFKKLRDESHKTALDHAKSFLSMLKDILRYSLGIRSLFALFRRLRRYIKEAFEALAEQVPEVNATMSELLSSFNMVKGSLATAFEPIVTAIAPMLDFLMEKLAQVMTYIGMFFAALTGRGYVYKANKSMTSFADTTKKAADNEKELNKQLQKFDELNNLTTQKDKKSGKAAEPPLATFEKVDIPDWIKDLAQKLKDIFNRIMDPIRRAWEKVGEYVVNAWKRAFNSVKDLLRDILRDFLRAWDELGESIATHFFLILGDIGHIIANIADKLREAWNTNENGYKIWVAILTIVDKILEGIRNITKDIRDWTATLNLIPLMTAFREWLESLIPVAETLMGILFDIWDKVLKRWLTWAFDGENSGIARFFRILRDFNKKVNWTKLRDNLKKLWDAIGQFGETVGEGLLLFIKELADRVANWVNSSDFERLMDKIAIFLSSIRPRDIKDDLDQVLRIIKNIAEAAFDVLKTIWSYKDKILNAIEWISEHIKGIIVLLLTFKGIIDIGRLIMNILLLVGSLEKVGGAIGVITTAVEFLLSPIGLVLTAVSLLAIGFGGAIKSVKDEFDKFTENLSAYNKINEDIKKNIDERQKSMSDLDTTKDIVHNLVGELDGLQSKTSLTADEQTRQKEIVDQLNTILPDLNLNIDEQTGKLNLSTEAILANADALIEQARVEAAREDLVQIAKHQYEAEKNLYNQKKDLAEAEAEYNAAIEEYRQNEKDYAEWGSTAIADSSRWEGAAKAVDALKDSIAESEQLIGDLDEEYARTTDFIEKYSAKNDEAVQKQSNTNDKIKESSDALGENSDKIVESAQTVAESTQSMADATEELSSSADSLSNTTTSIEDLYAACENLENMDLSSVTSDLSELGDVYMDSLPSSEDWSSYGYEIPESISSGITSNSSSATEIMASLASDMTEEFKIETSNADWVDIWSPVKTGFEEFWESFKSDVETDIQTFIGEIPNIVSTNLDMNTMLQPIDTQVSEFINTVKTTITTKLGEITTTVVDSITNMKVSMESSMQGINDTVASLMQSINDSWTTGLQNMNTTYAQAWQNMLQTTQQAIQQMGSMLNQLMSQLQNIPQALNQSMQQMNKISQQVSKMNIRQQISSRLRVPHLATGAVIPPNNEFLAVLGDQSRGTNIESPLSTMVEAFNQANKGGSEAELALLQEQNDLLRQLLNKEFGISESAIFKSVRNQNSIFTKSTGHSAFV